MGAEIDYRRSGFYAPKMTLGKDPLGKTSSPKLSAKPKLVKFAAAEADQRLLQAVEQMLATESYPSFSELCKAALRLMLFSPTARSDAASELGLEELRQQVQQLANRLTQLEQKLEAPADPPSLLEADPLLSRLAPLLEDF
jgi:Arc/MetJ-type ribon-helix-helix transcriptional regulator